MNAMPKFVSQCVARLRAVYIIHSNPENKMGSCRVVSCGNERGAFIIGQKNKCRQTPIS